jgi:hypothetical protein
MNGGLSKRGLMNLPHRLTNGALRLVAWSEQGLGRHLNLDRVLTIVSLTITLVSIPLSFVLAFAPLYAIPLVTVSVALVTLALIAIYFLSRLTRNSLAVIPRHPHRVRSKCVVVDIFDSTGGNANIEVQEEIVSLQDGLATIRKPFWGDWDAMNARDLTCEEPIDAVAADYFREEFASIFLVSLRRIYNYKDQFLLKTKLAVRNGFSENRPEYYCYTATVPVDRLQLRIVLPPKKSFKLNSVFARTGVGIFHYKERPVPTAQIFYAGDGRQQVTYEWKNIYPGWTCKICWDWEPSPVSKPLFEDPLVLPVSMETT